ncbi:MAG: DNA primase [Pyrinomonadaceae bacterium]
MLYPQHFIDELKNRADLVRIVETHVPLKKKGQNWWGNCPFHGEKTASFSVSPSKGFYKCFGCGKGGTAFNFVMEIEGLNFPEAIKRVAEISNVPLPEPVDDGKFRQSKKQREERKQLAEQVIELNQHALEFWENHLRENNSYSKIAREYLEKRGLSEQTINTFRIGFAPDSWDALMTFLKSKGADEKLIEISGLVSVNEEKNRAYDRFRGRVMFPVLDLNGRPIAFGARILDKGEPKSLNSPKTPAYVKGQHLYGLFQNKEDIRQKKFAILVEGYLDLIALFQFGITNCAASLGTAFTLEQSKLLHRFTRQIVINYDGDNAGIKAARRAIETLLTEDFEIKVLVLPNGQDPDDFLRANGTEIYNQMRGGAFPFLQFVLDNAVRERNLASPRAKAEAIEDVLPVISAIKNSINKRESFDNAMNFLRVEDTTLKRDLWKTVKLGANFDSTNIKQSVARATQIRLTIAEQRLLEMIIHDAELREIILPSLEETDFEMLATAAIFRALFSLRESGAEITSEKLNELVAEDVLAEDILPILLMSESPREPDETIDDCLSEAEKCVAALRGMAIARRIVEISQKMVLAERNNDVGLRDRLVGEQLDLARMKYELERSNFSEEKY